ncbi:branched-chain amino acid transport system II carrier protein [Fenollaria sporofastidiosus]|uniref:branched-chain amino acid transport system II carrier protein n=1 Tax=Fenollaria sporofastidiosus TaxID=2811778 RepID=UPI00203C6C49|nr:branched-chain amino acid transport system II carrier protein [Fenollaria sporofastidiosus]
MATIVISSVKKRGYTSQNDMFKMTVISGIIAALCLAFVYGGLVFIGGTGSEFLTIDADNPNRVANLIFMVNKIMGQYGTIALALTVALACLTTSIGLTATAGEFFSDLTHGKLKYKHIVIFTCLFSAIVSTNGVDSIITFSGPILSVLYPVAIVIILLNLFDTRIKYKAIYKGATLGAFMASLLDTIANIGKFEQIRSFLDRIPLGSEGFAWVIPAVVFGFAFIVLEMAMSNNNQNGVI